MDILEAHALLCETGDRRAVPTRVFVQGPLGIVDGWGLAATAMASLSGWLEDAATEADLHQAAAHGWSLLSGGVIRKRAVREESARIVAVVLEWGERREQCRRG